MTVRNTVSGRNDVGRKQNVHLLVLRESHFGGTSWNKRYYNCQSYSSYVQRHFFGELWKYPDIYVIRTLIFDYGQCTFLTWLHVCWRRFVHVISGLFRSPCIAGPLCVLSNWLEHRQGDSCRPGRRRNRREIPVINWFKLTWPYTQRCLRL